MGYEITWEGERGVVRRFFGSLQGSDVVNAVLDTQADARFAKLGYVINDYLAVEQASFDEADGHYIATLYAAVSLSNPRLRIAFVTDCPEIATLTTSYAESPRNVLPARTFATLAEARRWVATSGQAPSAEAAPA